MRGLRYVPIVVLLVNVSVLAQVDSAGQGGLVSFYRQHYEFTTMKDTMYTFASEFVLPDGFEPADSSILTPYQNWVANFPLWHRYKGVGRWMEGEYLTRDEVSRVVHLPWNSPDFKDASIPIRIHALFLHYVGRENELVVVPAAGDTLSYTGWLTGKLRYRPHGEVYLEPAEPREAGSREYARFVGASAHNTTYRSLTANCDTIPAADVAPGDMFVAHDDSGYKGVAYVIMHMLVNDQNQKLYAVATGCPNACDLYIPLLTEDRDSPWVDTDRIRTLAGDLPFSGFYRLRER